MDGKRCGFDWEKEFVQEDGIIDENRLERCTIMPYRGSLKSFVDTQSEVISAFIEIRNVQNDTCRLVPVSFDQEEDRVYIAEKVFNSSWKAIAQCIFQVKQMQAYRTGGKLPEFNVAEGQLDLSAYETETRRAVLERDQIKLIGKPIPEEQKQLMMKRSSAMDNKKMVYVYSAADSKVHDKACPLVKQISNQDFRASESLPEGRWLCLNCRMMMVVRRGCGDDFRHYDWYKRFFRKGGVREEAVEELVDRHRAKIRMEDPDVLWVKCGEEQWKIVLDEERKVTLLHNNYTMISDTERYISGGFHKQKLAAGASMAYAMKYIEGYTWERHLAAKAGVTPDTETQIIIAAEEAERTGAKVVKRPWAEMLKRLRAWIEAFLKREK